MLWYEMYECGIGEAAGLLLSGQGGSVNYRLWDCWQPEFG